MKKIIKNIFLIISIFLYCYLIFIGNNQYDYNISIFKSIIFLFIICVLIYTYGMVDNNDKTYKNNINIYIVLYFLILIAVTFFIGRKALKLYDYWYAGQYQPFHMIINQFKHGSLESILRNVIENSIMLIPLSFLLMIKNKKYNNILRQIIIILPITIIIEIFQAQTHTGSFDIDDIILNYFGTVIFTFLITRFGIIDKIRKLFYTDYHFQEKVKNKLFYFSIIILITYIMRLLLLK